MEDLSHKIKIKSKERSEVDGRKDELRKALANSKVMKRNRPCYSFKKEKLFIFLIFR